MSLYKAFVFFCITTKHLRNNYLLKQLQYTLKLATRTTAIYPNYTLAITKTYKSIQAESPPCRAQYLKIILALLVQSDTNNCCSKFLLASVIELPLLAVVQSAMVLMYRAWALHCLLCKNYIHLRGMIHTVYPGKVWYTYNECTRNKI